MATGFKLRYGAYTHAIGDPMLAISKQEVRDQRGVAYGVRERWQIQGHLTGSSPQDMRAKIAAIDQAYSVNGLDVALLMPDGSLSTHAIKSADTLGGVRIADRPSFPNGGGAEGCTIRRYTVGLEAVWPIAKGQPVLLSFQETIRFSGGGPRIGYLEPPRGRPIAQTLKQQTIWKGQQSGQARGLGGVPTVPLEVWPACRICDPEISITAQDTENGTEYQVTWVYEFESNLARSGKPHHWGLIKK